MTSSIQLLRRIRNRKKKNGTNQLGRLVLIWGLLGLPFLLIGLVGTIFLAVVATRVSQLQAQLPSPEEVIRDTEKRNDRPGPILFALSSEAVPQDLESPPSPADWIELESNFGIESERAWLEINRLPRDVQTATYAGIDPDYISRSPVTWLGLVLPNQSPTLSDLNSPLINHIILNDPLLEAFRATASDNRLGLISNSLNQIISYKIFADRYSSEFLAEWYINRAYYGNLRFGLDEAARYYFNQPVGELDLPQAAMLASTPSRPDTNLFSNPTAAKLLQEEVLETMLRRSLIQQDQYVAARFTPFSNRSSGLVETRDPAMRSYSSAVLRQAEAVVGPQQTRFGELAIYTPLDVTLQQEATCLIEEQIRYLAGNIIPDIASIGCEPSAWLLSPDDTQIGRNLSVDSAGLIVIDPQTGFVRALASNRPEVELSRRSELQPGSALMPITALTAFSQRMTLSSMLLDVSYDFGSPFNGLPYRPENLNKSYRGPLPLREALLYQSQPAFAQLLTQIGPQTLQQVAQEMGIHIREVEETTYTPLTLNGTGGKVSLEEMAFGYGVFANGGRSVGAQPSGIPDIDLSSSAPMPVYILRIDAANQPSPVYQQLPFERQVTTAELAYLVTDALSDDNGRCSGACVPPKGLRDGRPVARFYGQSTDYRDSWAIGFTPQRVVGVWAGNLDRSPMEEVLSESIALPIWHALMERELEQLPVVVRQQPAQISEQVVCYPSGLLPTDNCPKVTELFIADTTPTRFDDMVQEFLINRETGLLATPDTPLDLVESVLITIYPEEAKEWVEANGILQPPTEYDTLRNPKPLSGLVVNNPQPFDQISEPFEVKIDNSSSDYERLRIAWYPGFSANQIIVLEEAIPLRLGQNQTVARLDPADMGQGLNTLLLTFFRPDGSIEELALPLTILN